MSRMSVSEIMTQIAATVNQEATPPTEASSEWTLWLAYLNRAYQEWAQANDWESLRKKGFPPVTGISQATVSLFGDFRKLASPPNLHVDSTEGTLYPELLPEQEGMYSENDKYIQIVGNSSDGFSMIFHPASIASGASLEVQYFSEVTALASNTQYPVSSDPQYLVDRTIAYILEARSDPRFQIEENKARERLMTMIENNNASKYNSYASDSPVITTGKRSGFRVGRD